MAETPQPALPPAGPDPELAQHAQALLKKYCYRCHGVRFEVPGYNVLDRDILVATRGKDEPAYVVPGKPDVSYLWERVGVEKDMPPSGPKPSDDERALVRTLDRGRGTVPDRRPVDPPVPDREGRAGRDPRPPPCRARSRPPLPPLLHARQPAQQQGPQRRRPAAGPGRRRQAGQQPELEERDRRPQGDRPPAETVLASTSATSAGTSATSGTKILRAIPTA